MVAQHPKLILLLMTDQFRQDAFQPDITPNLYKLSQSQNATTFSNAYVSTPTCTPSRAGLLTGKSPWAHGMLGYANAVNCPNYTTTLPRVLTELVGNYETFSVGKNHFGWDEKGNYVTHGFQHLQVYDALGNQPYQDQYQVYFDQHHPGVNPLNMTLCDNGQRLDYNDWQSCAYGNGKEEEHPTPWTTRQAIKYLNDFFDTAVDENNQKQKYNNPNMFLKVSYHRPHSPYDPPRRLLEKHLHRYGHIPDRILNKDGWDAKFQNSSQMSHDSFYGDPGEAAAKHSRAGYLASVEFVDEGIGELMDWLVTHHDGGLFDDTMILWTTDHGDMNGDHNLWRKGYAYEGSSHVNLVTKLPNAWSKISKAPSISAALVETRDIAVTIYGGLGVLDQVKELDPMVDGMSLLPLLQESSKNPTSFRRWLDLEHNKVYREDIHWNAIVGFQSMANNHNNVWKYIFHVLDGREQLFCLTTDPVEANDLAGTFEWEPMLKYWRSIMVHQFQTEERGPEWVKDGMPVAGRKPMVFGPHFPCKTTEFHSGQGQAMEQ